MGENDGLPLGGWCVDHTVSSSIMLTGVEWIDQRIGDGRIGEDGFRINRMIRGEQRR